MEFLIGVFVGICFCCLIFKFTRKKPSGTFVIDFSDPLKDVCRLELDEELDSIYTKKKILLNVKTTSNSQ